MARFEVIKMRAAAIEEFGGATDIIELSGDYHSALRAAAGEGFDVVVDALFGAPLMAAIKVVRVGGRVVNVGMRAGRTMDLDGVSLKGKDLFSLKQTEAPAAVLSEGYARLIDLTRQGRITINHTAVPLEGIAGQWRRNSASPHSKLLLVI